MNTYHYASSSEAINDLKARGYSLDMNLAGECLKCPQSQLQLYPEDFSIEEMYRFEGMSNPSDSTVVYGIVSRNGDKGVLVDAYGAYAEAVSPEMAAKLRESYR